MTAHAGEDVEKKQYSSIADRIENWYSHSGNQSGGSSENWNYFYLKTKVYKELKKLDTRESNNTIKKWGTELNKKFSIEEYRMAESI